MCIQSKINRLPAYLTIQFVRFFYKEKEAINAKILKDIKFPLSLDVFDLCSPELQQKLVPMRSKFKVEWLANEVRFLINNVLHFSRIGKTKRSMKLKKQNLKETSQKLKRRRLLIGLKTVTIVLFKSRCWLFN